MGSETRKDLPDGSVRLSEEEAAAGRSRNCPRRLHSGRGRGGTVPATQPTPWRASAARRGDGQLWEGAGSSPWAGSRPGNS